jgi:hypothetical protein
MTLRIAAETLAAIDKIIESKQGKGFRRHLGASLIGRPCARQLWYVFRWAKGSQHSARLLRLFDRGNLEEERFVKWLRNSGIHVVDRDPVTGDQIQIEDHNGHFGGSLDAMLFDVPEFRMKWVLGEFKTHSDKYFKAVKKNGVKNEKEEHYAQMQVYMYKAELEHALYFAINKNDDDLYIEIIELDVPYALRMLDKAGKIISVDYPPERISETPGYYICRMCDYSDTCHFNAPKAMNCRTCVNSEPIENSGWICNLYSYNLSEHDQRRGCKSHTPIPE